MEIIKNQDLYLLIQYIILKSPKIPISVLAKIVFLTDYYHTLYYFRLFKEIIWTFDSFGPYSKQIHEIAKSIPEVIIEQEERGDNLANFYSINSNPQIEPDPVLLDIVNDILKTWKKMSYQEFIQYVYGSYPVRNSERGQIINLIDLCKKEQLEEVGTFYEEITKNPEVVEVIKSLAER